ncbi:energy transducer TonB [uncultured Ilyobacter sp.]|uniref:energy transducer TonB n=1 Tax=uncultured Ilyobacter sp. TaxID=544433 RepID=UPI0029C7E567|nr:energy transducer TonB [uncultured Ilyobacter sp.]
MKSLVISVFLHTALLYSIVLMNSNKLKLEPVGTRVAVSIVNTLSKRNPSTGSKKSVQNIKKGNTDNTVPKETFVQKNKETVKNPEKIAEHKKNPLEQTKDKKNISEPSSKTQKINESSHGKPHGNSDKGETKEGTTGKNENRITESDDGIGVGFDKLSDGSIVAKNQGVAGLKYGFISSPDPDYPAIAKKLGFDGEILVKVRMLVGENGSVEEIKFYNQKDKFGFTDEVRKTLKNWRLTPVRVGDRNVKMYLFKTFRFKLEN